MVERHWPKTRAALWLLGLVCAASAVVGPLAQRAHADLRAHMVGHVLLGMLAPLLVALAAPVTLAPRALPPGPARRVARVLRSAAIGILIHPVTAAVLDIGGLWVLYRDGGCTPRACRTPWPTPWCRPSVPRRLRSRASSSSSPRSCSCWRPTPAVV